MKEKWPAKRRLSAATAAAGVSAALYLPFALVYAAIMGFVGINASPWGSTSALRIIKQATGMNLVAWIQNMETVVLLAYVLLIFPLALLAVLLVREYIRAEILALPVKRDAGLWIALMEIFLQYPVMLLIFAGEDVDWIFSMIMAIGSLVFFFCLIQTLAQCVRLRRGNGIDS